MENPAETYGLAAQRIERIDAICKEAAKNPAGRYARHISLLERQVGTPGYVAAWLFDRADYELGRRNIDVDFLLSEEPVQAAILEEMANGSSPLYDRAQEAFMMITARTCKEEEYRFWERWAQGH